MQASTSPSVLVHFSDLVDPRVERTKLHPLLSVVAIALCGVICGADSWVEVEEFGKSRRDWLAEWLDLSAGIPSHDTFGRVFAALDPEGFEACFAGWVQAVAEATGGQVVAVDGKVSRGSHDRQAGRTALDLVSAWTCANRLVLAQVAVEQGSNEIPAIPALLRLLVLKTTYWPLRRTRRPSIRRRWPPSPNRARLRACRIGTRRTARWTRGMGEWRCAPPR